MDNIKAFGFADDIIIIARGREMIDKALSTLREECEKDKLKININKSAILIIRKDKRTPNPQYNTFKNSQSNNNTNT